MKISNASLLERLKLALFEPKARIEVFSTSDFYASRKLKKFAYRVAENLSAKHSELSVIDIYRTDDPYNMQNPLLWGRFRAYVISIPRNSDLVAVKKSCMDLELDVFGLRTCDIDVYETPDKKISRVDLGYKK